MLFSSEFDISFLFAALFVVCVVCKVVHRVNATDTGSHLNSRAPLVTAGWEKSTRSSASCLLHVRLLAKASAQELEKKKKKSQNNDNLAMWHVFVNVLLCI